MHAIGHSHILLCSENNRLDPNHVDFGSEPTVFQVEALRKSAAIVDVSIGADPGVALETRHGTGFYKVPLLRGVWMRSVIGHEGQDASSESCST